MDAEIDFFSEIVSGNGEPSVGAAAGSEFVDEMGGREIYDGSVAIEPLAEVGVFAVEKVSGVEKFGNGSPNH